MSKLIRHRNLKEEVKLCGRGRHHYPFCQLTEPGEQLLVRPELSGVCSDQIQRMTALDFHGGGRRTVRHGGERADTGVGSQYLHG